MMRFKVNDLFYAVGEDLLNTIRMEIILTEPVDPAALKKAAALAAARFPYFSVRPVVCGDEFFLEHNDAPIAAAKGTRPLQLGGPESNYHLVALLYEENRLYFNTTHFITDGAGVFPFLRTLLYCYLSTVHPEEEFGPECKALLESEPSEAEMEDDPYPKEPVPEKHAVKRKLPESVFRLEGQPQGYENMDQWTSFLFSIPQKELMRFVSGTDGSPATFFSSVVYRAISDLEPQNRLPIVCGMQHQFRGALKKPQSHMCHVNIVPIVYPEALKNSDIEHLNTIGRGTMILHADDDSDLTTVNAHVRNAQAIKGLALPHKRGYMRNVILSGIGQNTFEVSYTGRVPWAGLDKYIAFVSTCLDMTLSGGISVEIFSCGEDFDINIMQRNSDPRYVSRVFELLEDNGISYKHEKTEHFGIPGFAPIKDWYKSC